MTADSALLLHPYWPAPPNVRACVTLRRGGGEGVSLAPFDDFNLGAGCGDAPEAVAANRTRLAAIAKLPSSPRWLRQVHGVEVLRCASTPEDNGLGVLDAVGEADASIARDPGVVLAILTADCLPVLFAAADGSEVAAAHAGWRGLAAGVLEATVDAMRSAPDEIIAWLGPAAGPQTYEIGIDVFDTFVSRDAGAARHFVATRPGHWRVDLFGLARDRLAAAGVTRVFGGNICTISEPARFFSHRRDGRSGRMASLIWMPQ